MGAGATDFYIDREEKNGMKKRWLASFLSLCLLVALLPTAAMAVDEVEDPKVFTISDFFEAKADGTYDLSLIHI